MIKKFNLFLEEVRLKDISLLKGFDDKSKHDWGFDKTFDWGSKLVKLITINKRINGKKPQFKITYFDTMSHNIRDKILHRTTLTDVEEFNTVLKEVLTNLVEEDYDYNPNHKYAVSLKEHNFTLVFKLNMDTKEFNLYTILPGSGVNNVQDIFVYE